MNSLFKLKKLANTTTISSICRQYLNFNKMNTNLTLNRNFTNFSNLKFSTLSSLRFQRENPTLPVITHHTIRDNEKARKKKIQKGRGRGSGVGKTAGRGHKGKQRSYNPPVHIQGGQRPIHRTMPKFGSTGRPLEERFVELNIRTIHNLILKGRLDATKPIGIRELTQAGAVSKVRAGIKLLGKGLNLLDELPPLDITVSSASESVIKKIKERGGNISCKYMNRLVLKQETKPYRVIRLVKESVPHYKHILYYLKLQEKGANVIFLKPYWMLNNQFNEIKEKIAHLNKLLDEQPDAHLLPTYPVDRSEGCGLNKVRVQSEVKGREVSFDKSKIKKKQKN